MSRKKNMPSELKKLVGKIRQAEAKTKEQKKVYKAFKTENKPILRRCNILEDRIYKLERKERELQRQLGLFSDSSLTIPLLYKKRQETPS
jgi:predicted RNase H-like nuclease (RuvC/YqgF family)